MVFVNLGNQNISAPDAFFHSKLRCVVAVLVITHQLYVSAFLLRARNGEFETREGEST